MRFYFEFSSETKQIYSIDALILCKTNDQTDSRKYFSFGFCYRIFYTWLKHMQIQPEKPTKKKEMNNYRYWHKHIIGATMVLPIRIATSFL